MSSYDYDPSPSACAPYLFIGARGSGEPFKASDSPYGDTVVKVQRAMQSAAPNASVRQVYLDYQSSGLSTLGQDISRNLDAILSFTKPQPISKWNYFVSVQQGTTLLRRLLDQSFKTCPMQKIILSGYSQGALVVSAVLTQTKYSNPNNYAGVMLVADPANSPTRAEIDQGTAPHSALGIWSYLMGEDSVPLPLRMAGKVYSYCDLKDIVCDANDALKRAFSDLPRHPKLAISDAKAAFAAGGATHGNYPSTFKASAVLPIANTLTQVSPPATTTPPVTTPPTQTPTPAPTTSSAVVNIPDPYLLACVLDDYSGQTGIDRSTLTSITQAQLAQLKTLHCTDEARGLNIRDLTGLQYATRLTFLWIEDGYIADLSPIAGLKSLTDLRILGYNDGRGRIDNLGLSSIAPVAGLTNLQQLDIQGTFSNLTPLGGLTNLTHLDVTGQFTDVAPIGKLASLTSLSLQAPRNYDWLPLAPLKNCVMYLGDYQGDTPNVTVGVPYTMPTVTLPDGLHPTYAVDSSKPGSPTGSFSGNSVTWTSAGSGTIYSYYGIVTGAASGSWGTYYFAGTQIVSP